MISFLGKAVRKKLKGTALLRLDFNAEDEWRMKAAIPTIRFLSECSDKIVIFSHRGRPNGFDQKLSLRKNAADLAKLLGKKIIFLPMQANLPDFDFPALKKSIANSPRRSIFVLENLRFLDGERKSDRDLAKKLANLGDFYVNDSFAVDHRKDASLVAITEFLPSFAGLELEKEMRFLSRAMLKPKKPLVIVLGGAKTREKLGVIKYFRNKADYFLVGGVSANALLSISGVDVKNSMISKDENDIRNLRDVLGYKNLVLPVDFKFNKNEMIFDIGEKTAKIFSEKIKNARTIIWSGPMGAFEKKGFSYGTLAVARAIAKNKKAFSVIGGGETVTFLEKHGIGKNFSFISTGGGAMLEFLTGKKLPAIVALEKQTFGKR